MALLAGTLLAHADPSMSPPAPGYPQPPEVLFKDLFVAVQTAAIYPDGKTFADAVPDAAPEVILGEYHAAYPDSSAALRRFVDAHFSLPAAPVAAAAVPGPAPQAASLEAHIDGLWDLLTRDTPRAPPYGSLLPLPKPYVVPGGRFREIYYWDSYFTMLGLAESGRRELVADMVEDFAHLIDTYGHVPNGTRSYYLSRSQPPFFFEMVAVLAGEGADGAQSRYLPELRREYAFWMAGAERLRPGAAHRRVVAMPDGAILNRYWDDRDSPRDESYAQDVALARAAARPPARIYREIRAAAESGWDFSSRWFADGHTLATIDTTEIIPVDLNSLLFGLENAIRAACEHAADARCAAEFTRRAAARHAAIDRYLWSAPAQAYLDYRWTRHAPVARLSAATLYPLFVGLASPAQASAVAATTRRRLLVPGGVVTTPVRTGQQWDAPNGWAPLQWIAIAGLRQYRQDTLAGAIACRWLVNVGQVYRASGKLVEKYDVVTTGRAGRGGEYPTQDGFGWTNGVTRSLLALYPESGRAASCR